MHHGSMGKNVLVPREMNPKEDYRVENVALCFLTFCGYSR